MTKKSSSFYWQFSNYNPALFSSCEHVSMPTISLGSQATWVKVIITLSSVVAPCASSNGEFSGLKGISVRWNKPMKSEKQKNRKLKEANQNRPAISMFAPLSCNVGERNIVKSVLLSPFSVFTISISSKAKTMVIELIIYSCMGINMSSASQNSFDPSPRGST